MAVTMDVEVVGEEVLQHIIKQAPRAIMEATEEGALELTTTVWGVVTTPPALNSGNSKPTPYWVRGRGRVVSKNGRIDRPSYQFSGNTAHVKKMIVTKNQQQSVKSWSTVPYAIWVAGTKQSNAMARHGWKKLENVAPAEYRKYMSSSTSLTTKIVNKLSALFRR